MEFWMVAAAYLAVGVSLLIGSLTVPRLSEKWNDMDTGGKVIGGVVVVAGWPIIVMASAFAGFLG